MINVQKKVRGRPRKGESARNADRATMIEAARSLLVEGGSAALTARAVAERAGTAVGSVYGSFDSLEMLKFEANAVTMRSLRGELLASLRGAPEGEAPVESLLRLASAYIRFARENRNAWAAMFDQRAIETPDAIMADVWALFAVIEQVLGGIDGLDPADIPVVAKALWSSVHGMVYLGELQGLGPIGPDDVPGMVETLVRAAVRGLACGRG